jgi:hypothetical protein
MDAISNSMLVRNDVNGVRNSDAPWLASLACRSRNAAKRTPSY